MKNATKKQPAGGDGSGNGTEDIDHQVVEVDKSQPLGKIISIDEQIKLELAKFNLADAAIAQLKELYGGLTIAGPEDKEGYKAVKTAWNVVRSKRTGLEKKGLAMRNEYKVITTAISKEEDRLIDLVQPLEDDLAKKWQAIDEQKERAVKEQEEAEQKLLMTRIEDIVGLGMTFKDGFYVIGDTVSMDVATLRTLPDDQYKKLRTTIQNKAAELKKIADDEAAEKKLQQDLLKKQQDELKDQQQKLLKQQEDMRREQLEMAKQRREFRTAKLYGIGMSMNERSGLYSFDTGHSGFSIQIEVVTAMDGNQFTEYLEEATKLVKSHQDKKAKHDEGVQQETIAKEKKEKFIAAKMETAGLVYNFNAKEFQFKNEITDLGIGWNDLFPLDEEAITQKAEVLADVILKSKTQQTQVEKERKAEQEKQDKLALRDRQRWYDIMTDLEVAADKIDPTAFKAKTYQTKATTFRNRLTNLLKEFK